MVRELSQLLDPNAGVPQDFYDGPGPEAAVFLKGKVAAFAALGIYGPDPPGGGRLHHGAAQAHPGRGKQCARRGGAGCVQHRRGLGAFVLYPGGQGGQHRQPFPGPLVHAGLALCSVLLV